MRRGIVGLTVWHITSPSHAKCRHACNQTEGYAGKHDINKASFGSEFSEKMVVSISKHETNHMSISFTSLP
jgi:hypothetical protein